MNLCVKAGARGSPLSQKQMWEVLEALKEFHPEVSFDPVWITTTGDQDRTTSLRYMENSNFFTKEIDERQLAGAFRISIHSAKDLPIPLAFGLEIVALTKGLDPSDSLVLIEGKEPKKIATSSLRREAAIRKLYPEVEIVDIRGNIDERIAQLQEGKVDGVVVAECALLRLGLNGLYRKKLDAPVARYQGQLAVIARVEDEEMARLFSCLDTRACGSRKN